jgi:hypothetical protein
MIERIGEDFDGINGITEGEFLTGLTRFTGLGRGLTELRNGRIYGIFNRKT